MNQEQSPLDDFAGIARVFPLPNLVLYPYVMQPLHIFEPRYRQMTREALDDDRLIGLALLKPDWEPTYTESPDIYPIICLCHIVQSEELEDGRFNILVRGLSRARVIEELETDKLYRSFQVELLEEVPLPECEDTDPLAREIVSLVPRWFPNQPEMAEQFRNLLDTISLSTLCDITCYALPFPLEFKQALLGELNVSKRVQQLLDKLRTRANTPIRPSFPPKFSDN